MSKSLGLRCFFFFVGGGVLLLYEAWFADTDVFSLS